MKIEECIKSSFKKGSKKIESKEELARKLLDCIDFNEYGKENDSTIFHWLLLENDVHLIEKLLKAEQGRELALYYRDKEERTLLHYVVESKETRPEVLALLLEHLSQLVNETDEKGNTALHEAVLREAVWAIDILVSNNQLNRVALNHQGERPFDLACANPGFFDELIASDLKQIPFFDLQTRRISPTLDLECSLSLFRPNKMLLKAQRFSTPQLSLNEGVALWSQPLTSEEINKVFGQLVEASLSSTAEYQTLKEKAILVCQFTHLAEQAECQQLFTAEVNNKKILSELLGALQVKLEQKYAWFHSQISQMLMHLVRPLVEMNWQHSLETLSPPDFSRLGSNEKASQLLRVLWLITAGYGQEESIRSLQFKQISHQTLGLHNIASLEQIFLGLNQLYSYFDESQKMVASYMIGQLIYYHGSDLFKEIKAHQLKKIARRFQMEGLMRESENFYTSPLLRNFHALNQWNIIEKQNSFEQLLDQALANKSGKYAVETEFIAQELQCLTKNFYKAVTIEEFLRQKKNESDGISNIDRIANYFNSLVNYLVVKILSQPSEEKLCNAIKFFIQLGASLCSLPEPDLHHVMLISGVLNNAVIFRLMPELSKKDNRILQEIELIASQQNNKKYMRWALKRYPAALPYPGLLLSDLEFAKDGNCEDPLSQVGVVGGILVKVLEIKARFPFRINRPETDLSEFLEQYENIEGEKLYQISVKRSPGTPSALELQAEPQDVENLIDLHALLNVLDDHLTNYTIPSLKVYGKLYPPKEFANQLLICFTEQLRIIAQLPKEKIESFQKALLILEKILPRLIETYNQYCNKADEESLNPSFYLVRIRDIKAKSEAIKALHDNFACFHNDLKMPAQQGSVSGSRERQQQFFQAHERYRSMQEIKGEQPRSSRLVLGKSEDRMTASKSGPLLSDINASEQKTRRTRKTRSQPASCRNNLSRKSKAGSLWPPKTEEIPEPLQVRLQLKSSVNNDEKISEPVLAENRPSRQKMSHSRGFFKPKAMLESRDPSLSRTVHELTPPDSGSSEKQSARRNRKPASCRNNSAKENRGEALSPIGSDNQLTVDEEQQGTPPADKIRHKRRESKFNSFFKYNRQKKSSLGQSNAQILPPSS